MIRPTRIALGMAILGLAAHLAASPAIAASAPAEDVRVGLLLVAVDAQRDHLRISEAWRIANPGGPVTRAVEVALPEAAQYVTFHRGLIRPQETARGFADRLTLRPGITEVVFSYALPASRREVLSRVFPFPVDRLEIVVRGRGVTLAAMRGQARPPLQVGDEVLARWEVRGLAAGQRIVISLDNLPISQPWVPAAVALGLGLVLAVGLAVGLRRPVLPLP